MLSALICEYLDWAQLNHTLKVYQPECNSVINIFHFLWTSDISFKYVEDELSNWCCDPWKPMQRQKILGSLRYVTLVSTMVMSSTEMKIVDRFFWMFLKDSWSSRYFFCFLSEDVYTYSIAFFFFSVYKLYNHICYTLQ